MKHEDYLKECQREKIGYIAAQLRGALAAPYDSYIRRLIIRMMMRECMGDESFRHYTATKQETQWAVQWLHARKYQIPAQDIPDGVCLRLQKPPPKPDKPGAKRGRKKKAIKTNEPVTN